MSETSIEVPPFDKLINPLLHALHKLGGSASIQELEDEIVSALNLPIEIAELPHGKSSRTEIGYRAAWARTYMKKYGLLENSERGVWALTSEGLKTKTINTRALLRAVRKGMKKEESEPPQNRDETQPPEEEELDWRDQLLDLLQSMDPIAFERLCQRLLRESGFIEVGVTRRSGDGGIDGYGTIRLGGFISFNVLFQSKRYRKNIGPEVVRDFRGAMVGRADKGLIITTGGFTREARREATRDGAPPIDLIDGDLLIDKLKELKLGVNVKMVESVEVHEDWFKSF